MLFCYLCLPCCRFCFAYPVSLPILTFFVLPTNPSWTCSLGANFQSALLFSHAANLAAIFFFPSQLLCRMLFSRFCSLPLFFVFPQLSPCRTLHGTKVLVWSVPFLRFPFCFLHHFFLMPRWIRNNKQRKLGKEAEWPCSQK